MRYVLFLAGMLGFLLGLSILGVAKTALQEIEGFLILAIAAILFGSAVILEAIDKVRNSIDKTRISINDHLSKSDDES